MRGFWALTVLLACGCWAVAAEKNVVLIVTDDQGQDAGCYGNPVLKTPHLDGLAADGTRFANAYCTTASCSPSRSVILTGLYNHANAQYGLAHASNHFRTFENLTTLPVLLSEAGYRTARAGKFHVEPEATYRFDEAIAGNSRSSVELAENCREVIESESDQPFFLYFCMGDPHRGGIANRLQYHPDSFGNRRQGYPGVEPVHYEPSQVIVPSFLPDIPECRAELAQYYESVSRADSGLGRLLEILKETGHYDDTLIIYVSDNGMPFPGAKTSAYEASLKLPCVVRDPNISRRGVVNAAMISWVDIAPTVCDFAGVGTRGKAKMQGRSFLPIVGEQNPEGWNEVFASHTFHEITMYYPMRVVRRDNFKLIWNIAHELPFPLAADLFGSPTWQASLQHGNDFTYGKRTIKTLTDRPEFELYDLKADPEEVKNLADDPEHQAKLAELKKELRSLQKRTKEP